LREKRGAVLWRQLNGRQKNALQLLPGFGIHFVDRREFSLY
jgi:hypothetical protein